MKRFAGRIADRVQRVAARSRLVVRFAILIRNQARCVIKYHLAESPDVNETGEVWLREAVASASTRFVDVGANVGDWIGGIATLKGESRFEALVFEPSENAAARLKARFVNDPRMSVIEAAAGDSEGTLSFLEEPDAGRGSTLVPGLGNLRGAARDVRVRTLDSALDERGWDTVDVVKIDAEGYDARVIRGASRLLERGGAGVVQFEYNRAWQLAGDTLFGTLTFLEKRGYATYLLKRDGLYVLDYARYEEYFEYSNFVALNPEWARRLAGKMRGTI